MTRMRLPAVVAAASLAIVSFVAAGPITLELKSGSTIKGDLISWNGEQALIKAEFGEVKLSKAQLSTQALSELALSSGDA